ncbi:MAG: 4'-phosphopantetheinyl transferase family protein [Burkholderiaceae bacterium]
MNLKSKTIALDPQGRPRGGADGDEAVRIELARLDQGGMVNRRQRRTMQSAAARQLLAATLRKQWGDRQAGLWALEKSNNGQPCLGGAKAPSISLTHSGNWIACAVATSNCVGLDIEEVKLRDWEALAPAVLHPSEMPWVLDGSAAEQSQRGLLCWCRKEAIVKALGVGLSAPISLSNIGFSPSGELLALPDSLGSSSGWMSYSEIIGSELVVAAAWR